MKEKTTGLTICVQYNADILMVMRRKALKNIVGKGGNAVTSISTISHNIFDPLQNK